VTRLCGATPDTSAYSKVSLLLPGKQVLPPAEGNTPAAWTDGPQRSAS